MKLNLKPLMIILCLLLQAAIYSQPESTESLCGEDDRGLSNNKAVGRIWKDYPQHDTGPVGTAFIISNGKLITAGHIAGQIKYSSAEAQYYVEFQVPGPDAYGEPQPATDENRYKINKNSITENTHRNNGPTSGDDWGVIQVIPNSITNLMPIEAQDKYFNIFIE
jgi:hypothetical protein